MGPILAHNHDSINIVTPLLVKTNSIIKRKRTNKDLQNIHIKLKIEKHEPHSEIK
jgi:hypothetical protein